MKYNSCFFVWFCFFFFFSRNDNCHLRIFFILALSPTLVLNKAAVISWCILYFGKKFFQRKTFFLKFSKKINIFHSLIPAYPSQKPHPEICYLPDICFIEDWLFFFKYILKVIKGILKVEKCTHISFPPWCSHWFELCMLVWESVFSITVLSLSFSFLFIPVYHVQLIL